jgi:hypothetical protein
LRDELQSGHSRVIALLQKTPCRAAPYAGSMEVPGKSPERTGDRELLHIEEIYANRLTIAGIPEKQGFKRRNFVINTPLEPPRSSATTPCGYREPIPILRNQIGDCPLLR